MELKNYLQLAKRTMPNYGRDMNLYHSSTGVATEFGELIDNLKRHLFYKKEIDITNIKEELGDVCWYFAILFNELNIEPDVQKFEIGYLSVSLKRSDIHLFFNLDKKYTSEYQKIQLVLSIIAFVNSYSSYIDLIVNSESFPMCLVITSNPFNGYKFYLKWAELFNVVTVLCQYFEIDFNEVLELNIKKLESRYKQKNGQVGFTTESAINRDVDSERVILEGK